MDRDGPAVPVTEHGAVDDGSAVTTDAVQATIDDVAERGGGIALVPPGEYRVGTTELRSNVEFRVGAGATLLASEDPAEYGREELTGDFFWDDDEREGWREALAPLFVADGAEDAALTGAGTIDLRGEAFWRAGEGMYEPDGRPGMGLRFTRCRGLRVEDVRIRNSPGWTLHLRGCRDVHVENVRIRNSVYGPNTDGIDVDACRDVRISDCDVMAGGDDGIVLKNVLKGLREYPERPSRNVAVTNCRLVSTTNPFKIGTENVAGFEDIALSNATLRGPIPGEDYEVEERFGEPGGPYSGVALEMVDGAVMDGVTVSNVAIRGAAAPVFVRVGDRPRYADRVPGAGEPGVVRNVVLDGIVATGASLPSPIAGLPDGPVENVSVSDVRIGTAGGETDGDLLDRDVGEGRADYPEATQWGTLPATGFFCRHVEDLTLSDVTVRHEREDVRPAFVFEDVSDLELDGAYTRSGGERSAVRLRDVRRALLRGLLAPAAQAAVRVEDDAERVTVAASDLRGTDEGVWVGPDIPEGAVETR